MTSAAIGLTHVLGYARSKVPVADHGLTSFQATFLQSILLLLVGMAATSWPGRRVMWRCLFRPEEAWEQGGAAAALVVSNLLAVLAYTFLFVVAASALDKGQAPTYGHG